MSTKTTAFVEAMEQYFWQESPHFPAAVSVVAPSAGRPPRVLATPRPAKRPSGVMCFRVKNPTPQTLFVRVSAKEVQHVVTATELCGALEALPEWWTNERIAEASALFERFRSPDNLAEVVEIRWYAELRAAPENTSKEAPRVEEVPPRAERTTARLPVYSLEAVAAAPEQWGPGVGASIVEPLGWREVQLLDRRATEQMFVARIAGHSMDDGASGLRDGCEAVFEFGSVQDGSVGLICGSFHDAETGTYAVKRVSSLRDEHGVTTALRLESLNPDKTKYPDLHVDASRSADVRVIARWIQSIAVPNETAVPKKASVSKRDLSAVEPIQHRLDRRVSRFFLPDASNGRDVESARGWEATLVTTVSNELQVVCGPLVGLPKFVSQLRLQAAGFATQVIAANARTGVCRVAVKPWHGALEFVAVGFEDDLADELRALRVEGFERDRATVFACSDEGAGPRLTGATLTRGQSYTLWIPPLLQQIAVLDAEDVGDGWRRWNLSLGTKPESVLDATLASLGCSISPAQLQLKWALTFPRCYREGRTGERYPVFRTGDPLCVHLTSHEAVGEGELALFASGAGEFQSVFLPAGTEWFVTFEGIRSGNWGVEALSAATTCVPAFLFFEVDDRVDGFLPRCEVEVILGEERVILCGDAARNGDLALVLDRLAIRAPPLWRLFARWKGVREQTLGPFFADAAGGIETRELSTELQLLLESPGTLELDFGELGVLSFVHHPQLKPERVAARLRSLFEERGSLLASNVDFDVLRSTWFSPVCAALHYDLREVADPIGNAPQCFAWTLVRMVQDESRLIARTVALLVVVRSQDEVTRRGEHSARHWAEHRCRALKLRWALLTDGRWWLLHRVGSSLAQHAVNLEAIVNEASPASLEDFLARLEVE